ncbi:MAG TPA: ABC-type transport auxiliary lipoprotein family protein [Polyangia bacterium]
MLWLALAPLAAACSVLPAPQAPEGLFLLSLAPAPPAPAPPAPAAGGPTLLVGVPLARPGLDTSRMLYTKRAHAVSFYGKSQWADTPARMLAPLLAQALEATGAFRAVVRLPSAADGDLRLDTEDLALVQEFTAKPSRVRLSLRALLVDVRTQAVVATRRFEVEELARSDDAYGGVVAANRAAARLMAEIGAWAPPHATAAQAAR